MAIRMMRVMIMAEKVTAIRRMAAMTMGDKGNID
jgi:hypothetical protein